MNSVSYWNFQPVDSLNPIFEQKQLFSADYRPRSLYEMISQYQGHPTQVCNLKPPTKPTEQEVAWDPALLLSQFEASPFAIARLMLPELDELRLLIREIEAPEAR